MSDVRGGLGDERQMECLPWRLLSCTCDGIAQRIVVCEDDETPAQELGSKVLYFFSASASFLEKKESGSWFGPWLRTVPTVTSEALAVKESKAPERG